jgi:predicted transcriptional regulator
MLSVSNRERLRVAVETAPGIHLRRLQRELGLSFSTVRHHAFKLAKEGRVEFHRYGRYSALFPAGFPRADMEAAMVMKRATPAAILHHLLTKGRTTNGEISKSTGLAKSTVSRSASLMVALGILKDGQAGAGERRYQLGEGTIGLLRRCGGGSFRLAVDRYVELWGF